MQSNIFLQDLEARRLLSGSSANAYTVTNLVSDLPGTAMTQDANLVNGWGLAAGPTGAFFVANNGTATITDYSGPTIVPPTVQVAGSPSGSGSDPTGLVYNNTNGFLIGTGKKKIKATFLSSSEDGTIAAYAPKVSATQASVVIDSTSSGAVYKGLAVANVSGKPMIFAADFHNAKVAVFDKNFAPTTVPGGFTDPNLPAGYAPFNITVIKNKVYVAYAQQDSEGFDEVDAAGAGAIDVFTTQGQFVQRLATGGTLDAPWGMTMAPSKFGAFSNDLLIGNFGDGTIDAFNLKTGTLAGQLDDSTGTAISINGLWGLGFGNGKQAGPKNFLYFAAGTNDESDGTFGAITTGAASSSTSNQNSSTGSSPGGSMDW